MDCSAFNAAVEFSRRPRRAAEAPMESSCAETLKLEAKSIDRTSPDGETTRASDHIGHSVGRRVKVTVAVARAPLSLATSWQMKGPTAGPLRKAGRSVMADASPARRSCDGGRAAAEHATPPLASGSSTTTTASRAGANPQTSVALELTGGQRLSAKPKVTLGSESDSVAALMMADAPPLLTPPLVNDMAIGNHCDFD